VFTIIGVKVGDDERPVILPTDLDRAEALIREHGVRFVVVDPFMAFLDGEINAHRDQDVRRCLHRFKLLAESTRVAILLVRHLNKLNEGPAIYRGGGSIGITGAARSALVVGRNPNQRDQCVLASVKSNLAKAPPSLSYGTESDGPNDPVRIAWGDEVDLTADEILQHPKPKGKLGTGEQCAQTIRELLEPGVKMRSAALEEELRDLGFSAWAQREGKKLAGVQSEREGFGPSGKWYVWLPTEDGPIGEDIDEESP
jgi:hypothetical protein